MNKLKKGILVLLCIVIASWSYVEIVNRHSRNMTIRQKFLRAVYPAFTILDQHPQQLVWGARHVGISLRIGLRSGHSGCVIRGGGQ